MFKAVFVYTINIVSYDDVTNRRYSKFQYRMEKEFDIPFVPVEKSLFMDGDNELGVECAHYDLLSGKFIVNVGGGLCDDEQEVQESLDYELSRGWTVARRNESR
jgi:hypothetical protein